MAFPRSLQSVSLEISHYDEIDPNQIDWYSPIQLQILELHCYDLDPIDSLQEGFLSSLLKKGFCAETLVFKFYFTYSKSSSLELLPMLKALEGIESLKHLGIRNESEKYQCNLVFNLKCGFKEALLFSQLTSFEIDCLIQEPLFLKDFLQVFLADSQGPRNLYLSTISFSSAESFIEFFQVLNICEGTSGHNIYLKIHLRVRHIGNLLQDFDSCLILQENMQVDLIIDSLAGSAISQDQSEKIIDHLQNIFPQFKVTNDQPSDTFSLRNDI